MTVSAGIPIDTHDLRHQDWHRAGRMLALLISSGNICRLKKEVA